MATSNAYSVHCLEHCAHRMRSVQLQVCVRQQGIVLNTLHLPMRPKGDSCKMVTAIGAPGCLGLLALAILHSVGSLESHIKLRNFLHDRVEIWTNQLSLLDL